MRPRALAALLGLLAAAGGARAADDPARGDYVWTPLAGQAMQVSWKWPDEGTLEIAYQLGQKGMFGMGFGTNSMAGDALFCFFNESSGAFVWEDTYVTGVATRPRNDLTLGGSEPGTADIQLVFADIDEEEGMFVVFRRPLVTGDRWDAQIDLARPTEVTYAWSDGDGVVNHGLGGRGAGQLHFGVPAAADSFSRAADTTATFYRLHGVTMVLTWVVAAPVAVAVVRYFKAYQFWISFHRGALALVVTVTVPLVWGTLARGGGQFRTAHSYLGVAAALLCLFQYLCGSVVKYMWKHESGSPSYRPVRDTHRLVGWSTVAIALAACYEGARLLEPGWRPWLAAWYSALCLAFAVLEARRSYDRRGAVHRLAARVPLLHRLATRRCAKVYAAGGKDPEKGECDDEDGAAAGEDEKFLTADDVRMQAASSGMGWVICGGAVYNVADFSKQHPGGAALLRSSYGGDISGTMDGTVRVGKSGVRHPHSRRAYRILERYRVATLTDDPAKSFLAASETSTLRARRARRLSVSLRGPGGAGTGAGTGDGAEIEDDMVEQFYGGLATVESSRPLGDAAEGGAGRVHEVVLRLEERGADLQAYLWEHVRRAGSMTANAHLHVGFEATPCLNGRPYTVVQALQREGGPADASRVRLFVRSYAGGAVSEPLCRGEGRRVHVAGPVLRCLKVVAGDARALLALAQGTAVLAFADLAARAARRDLLGVERLELHASFATEDDILMRPWFEATAAASDGRFAVRWYVQHGGDAWGGRTGRFDAARVGGLAAALGSAGAVRVLVSGNPRFEEAVMAAAREAGHEAVPQ